MGFLQRAYTGCLSLLRFSQRIYGRVRYIEMDTRKQKRDLKTYSNDIARVLQSSDQTDKVFAAFVFYNTGGNVPKDVVRLLTELKARDVQVLLASNTPLNDAQLGILKQYCHSILQRNNQGYDFGAYKDIVGFLIERTLNPHRLFFLNDSVFFRQEKLNDFVDGLLGPADVIAAFENWAEDHHLQSFALSVSGAVFNDTRFQSFWKDYVPVSNRIYAIENGEKELSRVVLGAAKDHTVLYSVSDLYDAILRSDENLTETHLLLPRQWNYDVQKLYERLQDIPSCRKQTAHTICSVIGATSPIHAGAYFFPRFLSCPLLKKDLVYRQRFEFWEVEQWASRVMSQQEKEDYLKVLRLKGDANALRGRARLKYDVGVQ